MTDGFATWVLEQAGARATSRLLARSCPESVSIRAPRAGGDKSDTEIVPVGQQFQSAPPVFARRYRPWYPKAVDVLEDDWERMVAFYDFPEDHWKHLRTTNVVESPFAALRLRTTAEKRFKRVESATALIWKLLLVAEKRVRRLDAPHLLKDVFEGRKFEDGKPVSTQQRKNAA